MPYKDKEKQSAFQRQHYEDNKSLYLLKARQWNKTNRAAVEDYLFQYLNEHPCLDCSEIDAVLLEFDHRSQAEKVESVATMVAQYYSVKTVKAEVAKCDVRCVRCHRLKTARDAEYWLYRRSRMTVIDTDLDTMAT